MISIGNYNELKVLRESEFGYFLDGDTGKTSDDILLPKRNLPEIKIHLGDMLTVFIYRDSEDRLIATLSHPKAIVSEIAYLNVVSNTSFGSFINVGLERDVFVPLKEKHYELTDGNSYLFYIYLDKTKRIAASTKIDDKLSLESPYNIGDNVSGIVYGFQTNGTAMIAVDSKYKGVILKNEYFNILEEGNLLDLRVIKIYEDGKLGLTPRKTISVERSLLEETILEYLKNNNGFMTLNDKSSPDEIHNVFHQSKNYFKNALGGLMKAKLISQDKNGTKLL